MRTFADIPEEFAQEARSKNVLIPVPYDGTSTWIKGADKGPEAFLEAAENMELYDIATDSEVYRQGIFLDEPVTEDTSPEQMTAAVKARVIKHLQAHKFVTLFGGEHSISIGSIQAHAEKYEDLTILQLDAHADLRPSYEGSEYNHACAMHWASQNLHLVQAGIRSMDISEKEFMHEHNTFFMKDHRIYGDQWPDRIANKCTENVYLTVDLDVLDPSEMPSTGTPEPGGLTYIQLLRICELAFRKRNVVGFDIVELCPNPSNKAPDFLAAKLYYQLLSFKYHYS